MRNDQREVKGGNSTPGTRLKFIECIFKIRTAQFNEYCGANGTQAAQLLDLDSPQLIALSLVYVK